MAEYYVPARDSETEFTEKRSRFIGHVWRVEQEEEAREKIAQMKAKHYDARHNCWCYLIREGGIVRYSDDGEPQGTAGPANAGGLSPGGSGECLLRGDPVLRRNPPGHRRAAAGLYQVGQGRAGRGGIAQVRQWAQTVVECPYPLLERVKLEIAAAQGILGEVSYGAQGPPARPAACGALGRPTRPGSRN